LHVFQIPYLSRVKNDPQVESSLLTLSNNSMKDKSQIKCFCKTLINIKTK